MKGHGDGFLEGFADGGWAGFTFACTVAREVDEQPCVFGGGVHSQPGCPVESDRAIAATDDPEVAWGLQVSLEECALRALGGGEVDGLSTCDFLPALDGGGWVGAWVVNELGLAGGDEEERNRGGAGEHEDHAGPAGAWFGLGGAGCHDRGGKVSGEGGRGKWEDADCILRGKRQGDGNKNLYHMKTYRAPWGKSLIVISGVLVVLSVVSVVVWPVIVRGQDGSALWLVRWALPMIALGCLPFMVLGYTITEDAIWVRRLLWRTRVERSGLQSAEYVPKVMNRSLRTCGNGGGFSFTGWYWSKPLGFYRAFVTDLNRTVVLRFEKRTVVVSPDDPEGFVEEVKRRADAVR